MKPGRFLYPLFLLIVLVTYFPSMGSGFVFDFVGWQARYDPGSFADILNCFGYKGNQQVYHLFFYTIYSLFHLHGLAWYFIFCAFHALNGWLMYQWINKIALDWKISIPKQYVLLTCILILVHPYCVEPVVFKACIHYLVSLSAILSILIIIPKYVLTGEKRFYWFSLMIFASSLFAIEIAYITPMVISVYLWMYGRIKKEAAVSKSRSWIVATSFWLMLLMTLLMNKLTLGAWVGHYGADIHLHFDLVAILANEIKYLFKHLTDARMFTSGLKSLLFDQWLSNKIFITLASILGLVLAARYVLKSKTGNPKWHLVFFALAGALLYTLPVSNLFFYHLDTGINDRFSYVPLMFTWVSVLALLSGVSKKWILPALSALILIQIYFQQKIITNWKESTLVLNHLKADYRWRDASHVFVLNSPDNYNGIWMTSMIKGDSGIDELIDRQTEKPNHGVMYDIYQFNMISPNDGVKVEQTGPMQLKVTFKQWGNWWQLHALGAPAYENEFYKAEVLDYPYQVTFKQFPEGSVIIYQDSMKWKEFVLQSPL